MAAKAIIKIYDDNIARRFEPVTIEMTVEEIQQDNEIISEPRIEGVMGALHSGRLRLTFVGKRETRAGTEAPAPMVYRRHNLPCRHGELNCEDCAAVYLNTKHERRNESNRRKLSGRRAGE